MKQRRRRRLWERHLKSEFALPRIFSRSFHLVQFAKCWQYLFWSWILKDCIKVHEKESYCLLFPSATKRKIRKFHVVVVQRPERRQRNHFKKADNGFIPSESSGINFERYVAKLLRCWASSRIWDLGISSMASVLPGSRSRSLSVRIPENMLNELLLLSVTEPELNSLFFQSYATFFASKKESFENYIVVCVSLLYCVTRYTRLSSVMRLSIPHSRPSMTDLFLKGHAISVSGTCHRLFQTSLVN